LAVAELLGSLGTVDRTAGSGLRIKITDDPGGSEFQATVAGEVIGRQPYRRYREHIVLMATHVDEQWRERGVSSALIDGTLGIIRSAGATVVPRCKLTGDYILHHPEFRDLVPGEYQALLRQVSRPRN
jgi:uncharacterized protein